MLASIGRKRLLLCLFRRTVNFWLPLVLRAQPPSARRWYEVYFRVLKIYYLLTRENKIRLFNPPCIIFLYRIDKLTAQTTVKKRDMTLPCYMANSVSKMNKTDRALWLATRAGKMELSCPLGITRRVSSTPSRSINTQRENLANIHSSWPHTWPITHIIYWTF